MATLAELREQRKNARPVKRARRALKVCTEVDVIVDIDRLQREKEDLLIAAAREIEEGTAKVRKMATTRVPPRVVEIDVELDALFDVMRAAEKEIVLQAIDPGQWQLFKDENPARDGNESDARVTYGRCDAAALLADLGRYVVQWDGDDLVDGDWELLRDEIAGPDQYALCTKVVEMHEAPVSAPKSRTPSSPTPNGETD